MKGKSEGYLLKGNLLSRAVFRNTEGVRGKHNQDIYRQRQLKVQYSKSKQYRIRVEMGRRTSTRAYLESLRVANIIGDPNCRQMRSERRRRVSAFAFIRRPSKGRVSKFIITTLAEKSIFNAGLSVIPEFLFGRYFTKFNSSFFLCFPVFLFFSSLI